MNAHVPRRLGRSSLILSRCFAVAISTSAAAAPSFISFDNRLPNPDRPYVMTSGTVEFLTPPIFGIYALQFQAANPSQLEIPTLNMDGNWQFDSNFDITYQAVVSVGLEPAHSVTGLGKAHAVGTALGGIEPKVYDTELVALNLFGLSPIPELMFRESPTLRSSGVTTVEDACPMCASPVPHNRISSFFDIFAEVTFNGNTWTPGNAAIHVEQEPAAATGDYNFNGLVDAADYTVWRDRLGAPAGTLPNDTTGGVIGPAQYNTWKANFGATSVGTGAGSGVAKSAAVPEPATSVLLILAAVSWCCRRRFAAT